MKHLKILARSRPEHKLKLVEGLKKLNNIVAVTGDGTNDAPALLKANVGVAMGISGTQVAKNAADVLILDDWGMEPLTARQANDLLDVMEMRYQQSSTIIASQIPTSEWYKLIPSPTIADALLDRLLHNSHRIELTGDSMRKLDQSDHLA